MMPHLPHVTPTVELALLSAVCMVCAGLCGMILGVLLASWVMP
jgi:hypothetical protein